MTSEDRESPAHRNVKNVVKRWRQVHQIAWQG
jgi:hypothetical protein